jgi:hypothetical protein
LLPAAETAETMSIFHGGGRPHAAKCACTIPSSTLDLEHLVHFKFRESWMGQIKQHGNPRHTIRSKPFVRQPKVGTEYEPSGFEFGVELPDLS